MIVKNKNKHEKLALNQNIAEKKYTCKTMSGT